MLFPDECSIALKELSGILDELLARRHRFRLSGLRIRELLCNPRHFAVETRLIPRRLRTFNARVVVDKGQWASSSCCTRTWLEDLVTVAQEQSERAIVQIATPDGVRKRRRCLNITDVYKRLYRIEGET